MRDRTRYWFELLAGTAPAALGPRTFQTPAGRSIAGRSRAQGYDQWSRIIERTAATVKLSPGRVEDVTDVMWTAICRQLAQPGGRVTITGFGTFGPAPPPRGKLQGKRKAFWHPDPRLIETLNRPAGQPAETKASQEPDRMDHVRRIKRPWAPALPLRAEDYAMIDRFIAFCRGSRPERATESMLYGQERRWPRAWAEETCNTVRGALQVFARRCPVPLVQVGLTRQNGGPLDRSALRQEIIAYANDYAARNEPRYTGHPLFQEEVERRTGIPFIWQTPGWIRFVRRGTLFYDWLEREGLRPPGTNPFQGIRRGSQVSRSKGKIVVVRRWFEQMLAYPHLAPRDAALLYLLANGLRVSEVARLRLSQVALSRAAVTVVGKGGKIRTVYLRPRTVEVLDRWLQARRYSASPWCFPGIGGRGHLMVRSILWIVQRTAERVFPPHAERIRRYFSPHKFRHFYVSESLRAGVDTPTLMQLTGHSTLLMLSRYASADEQTVRRTVARTAKRMPM